MVCQCIEGRTGSDCSFFVPKIESVTTVPFGSTNNRITINGKYLGYIGSITVSNIACTDFQLSYIESWYYKNLTCVLDSSNLVPETTYTLTVTTNSYDQGQFEYIPITKQSFSNPNQALNQLSIQYSNLYDFSKLTFTLNTLELVCTKSNAIQCQLPPNVKSGNLVISNDYNSNTQSLVGIIIKHYITSINNNDPLPRSSGSIEIEGMFFKSNSHNFVFIKDNLKSFTLPDSVGDQLIVFTKSSEILMNKNNLLQLPLPRLQHLLQLLLLVVLITNKPIIQTN